MRHIDLGCLSSTVVVNLGSIELQRFVESVSVVQQRSRILRLFSTIPFFGGKGKHIHPQTFQNILCLVTFITVRQIPYYLDKSECLNVIISKAAYSFIPYSLLICSKYSLSF